MPGTEPPNACFWNSLLCVQSAGSFSPLLIPLFNLFSLSLLHPQTALAHQAPTPAHVYLACSHSLVYYFSYPLSNHFFHISHFPVLPVLPCPMIASTRKHAFSVKRIVRSNCSGIISFNSCRMPFLAPVIDCITNHMYLVNEASILCGECCFPLFLTCIGPFSQSHLPRTVLLFVNTLCLPPFWHL